ncbi:hypothetical protein [Dongia sp.]|uniref:hypothetical protein n=1 Tax=Dongia sp. TaxID=1977262 RepID=UPI003752BFC3
MRFDLLDEYSTLVPFGLGALPKRAAPAETAERETTEPLAYRQGAPRKRLAPLRHLLLSALLLARS